MDSPVVRRFGATDYAVFAVMLFVSAAIGVFYGCTGNKQSTTSEFLFGEKSLKILPVSISVLATFLSAISLLGVPAEVYQFGIQYWMVNIAYCLMLPVTAHLYMPVFYKLQVSSIYEYLEKRFNRTVRILAFGIQTACQLLYLAFVVYAPSLVLSQVTGLNSWVCVLSIGVVCIFYTTIGGIKAVVWTDVFQTIVIYGAMFTVVIKGSIDNGGIAAVWKTAEKGERINLINLSPDPTVRHTLWSLSLGGFITWLSNYGVQQSLVQRTLTIPTLKGAKAVVWLNLPGNILTVTITCLAGLVVYANYASCDPIRSKQVNNPNQVFPLFVMDTLSFLPGMAGLFVSGVFSGALSTLSSALNSLAAVTLEDLVKTLIAPKISEVWATRTAKLLALGYGVIALVMVAVVEQLSGTVIQAALSITSAFNGPLLGLFTLGMLFPWPTSRGAVVGLVSGCIACLWISIGGMVTKRAEITAPFSVESCSEVYPNFTIANSTSLTNVHLSSDDLGGGFSLYRLSYLWYSTVGLVVVVVVGLISSINLGNGEKTNDVDPALMSPFFYNLWGCDKKRKVCQQHSNYSEKESTPVKTPGIFKISKPSQIYPMWGVNGLYKRNENDAFSTKESPVKH